MIADPLGYDWGYDPTGRSASGADLLEASILQRLTCETIDCIDAPDGVLEYGVDARGWLGEVTDADSAAAKVALVDRALHLDPRIASTQVEIRPVATSTGEIEIEIVLDVTAVTGQRIERIVSVSAVGVAFLGRPN
jgi:hypothetical protein